MIGIERRLIIPCRITNKTTPDPDIPHQIDEYGNVQLVETTVSARCYIEQLRTTESSVDEHLADSTFMFAVARDVPIAKASTVQIDGFGTFEVHGEPTEVWDPLRRRVSHIEATLRRTA